MSYIENFKRLGRGILDLVFPISCLVCGRDGEFLCSDCLAKLPRLEKQKCIVCTKPSPFGKTHPDCVTRNTVDGMICAASYQDKNTKKIIETFKYNFVSDLSKPLAQMITETVISQNLLEYFQEFILVPVPLHKKRLNWRGFNQAVLLAMELSQNLKIPIEDKLAIRDKHTKPQVNLTADERKRNIENAFSVTSEVAGKKILLVDDVVTSGSTANEIAKLLKSNKAAEIWILAFAHG